MKTTNVSNGSTNFKVISYRLLYFSTRPLDSCPKFTYPSEFERFKAKLSYLFLFFDMRQMRMNYILK